MSAGVSRARAKFSLTSPEPEPEPEPAAQLADLPPGDKSLPKPIDPRVLAALEQPPTPHAAFVAADRTAEVRLTDADWRNVCSDCHSLLSRERVGRDEYLSCATCSKRGLLQRSARGGEYVRWIKTPNERNA